MLTRGITQVPRLRCCCARAAAGASCLLLLGRRAQRAHAALRFMGPDVHSEMVGTQRCVLAGARRPLVPTTLSVAPGHKRTVTLLPPPRDMADPLAFVDLARSAEVRVRNLLATTHNPGLVEG